MCGIAGKINFDGFVDGALLERMCRVMEHRGPDSRGIYNERGAGLGMQRLAIIDVAGGDQPIFSEDGQVAVVMNGEIYNFQELRDELVDRGHKFSSRCDTEVLVHLYEEFGERLVERLRGMFAFAIWDLRRRRLLLGRDRVGKKPLFWARRGNEVWFASEVMSLLQDPSVKRTPDPRALASYLAFQYVPNPLSAFRGVEKLAPATTLSITADGEVVRRYWRLDYSGKVDGTPMEELEEQLREHIWEATRIRLISEVPLGAFLSGGIDSSVIVAAMAEQMSDPVKTFSIGFRDADFDELQFARMVAKRFTTDHHEFVIEPHALEIMPKLARHYGEPFADPSAIPSFYLAELTSQHVTVALNGDGGDESFAGYRRYISNDIAAHFSWLPCAMRRMAPHLVRPLGEGRRDNSTRARIKRLAGGLAMEPSARYAYWMSAFPAAMRADMLQPEFLEAAAGWEVEEVIGAPWRASSATSRIDCMLDTDVNTYLPGDLLVKMDIATMAYSVEGRSPLLDHKLMEFAASLPAELKLRGMTGKRLLKSSLRGVIPDEVLDRAKMGFGVPLPRWFREELRELPREVLMGPDARVHSYVRPAAIEQMISDHHAQIADHSLRLWVLLQLEYWHREVVESPLVADDTSAWQDSVAT